METREKIYSGLFVLIVVGVTILLNSSSIRNANAKNQIVDQENTIITEENVQLAIDK